MNILLLSAYDTPSHQRWWQGLKHHLDDMNFTVLSLPPRYFQWRLRGNSLSWAMSGDKRLTRPYDLILATDMTDLASLKGLMPHLAPVPALVYFHENQFAYPGRDDASMGLHTPVPTANSSNNAENLLSARILNLYTALAADSVLFNSQFNRDSFMEGVGLLLKQMPDKVPPGILQRLQSRSSVLPVPVDVNGTTSTKKSDRFTLVWNHRWEYDKGPGLLLALIDELLVHELDFEMHLLGQQFRQVPREFSIIKSQLEDSGHLGLYGHVDSRDEYLQVLARSHVVISTAIHEFQGMAVLEAVTCGCLPLVPDRLSYRELFAVQYRYASCEDAGEEAQAAVERIIGFFSSAKPSQAPKQDHLSWQSLANDYRKAILDTANLPDSSPASTPIPGPGP